MIIEISVKNHITFLSNCENSSSCTLNEHQKSLTFTKENIDGV